MIACGRPLVDFYKSQATFLYENHVWVDEKRVNQSLLFLTTNFIYKSKQELDKKNKNIKAFYGLVPVICWCP
jgi:hypothetical protein